MKKWKKLLACLLAGLLALAVFTACDGSAGVPIGPKHSDASSAKALCEQLGMTYSEELSDKAYSIANWVSATSVSCSANTNKTELYRVGSANDIAKTNLLQHNYATAFESMGMGIYGSDEDFVPGFYIDTDLDSRKDYIRFVLPKDGIVDRHHEVCRRRQDQAGRCLCGKRRRALRRCTAWVKYYSKKQPLHFLVQRLLCLRSVISPSGKPAGACPP